MNNVSSGFKSLDCRYLIGFPEIVTGSGKTIVAGYSIPWSVQIIFLRIESPAFDLSKMLYDVPKYPRASKPQLTYGYVLISVPSLFLSNR